MWGVSSATRMPSSSYEESKVVITSAVAMRVFEGTQSVSTEAPPRPSQSTTVTSAPSWAPTRAASYPPGPPPIITIRVTYFIVPHAPNCFAPGPTVRGVERVTPWSVPSRRRPPPATPPPPSAVCRTLDVMSLYAAYAGNLDARLMTRRAPHSPLRATGWLDGWRLTFGGEHMGWEGALATVVEDPASQVFVALYDIAPPDEEAMDGWEGVGLGIYRRARVRVHTLEGTESSWLYVLNGYEGGLPSARYLGEIADAAESAGAPHDYVMELRKRPC
ncbi:AIG2-like family protein [Streptomyces sp. DfronAA-171]|nr:AIG2-like family protein [Streptomyces sp. DfronAA-171]